MTEDTIYEEALEAWGVDAQIKMAIEEMGELIVKLAKYGRNVNSVTNVDVAAEIADVEIMMKQMRLIFNSALVNDFTVWKLERLRQRLEKGVP
jgi:ubiquitin